MKFTEEHLWSNNDPKLTVGVKSHCISIQLRWSCGPNL